MKLQTHLGIDSNFSGKIISITHNSAEVELKTQAFMQADSSGLVHGGFAFSAADFCAMATINHPDVVLTKSEVKFTAPVVCGQIINFKSIIQEQTQNKSTVLVEGFVDSKKVFLGTFYTFIPPQHILS